MRREIFGKTILENPFIPHKPTVKQARFLLLDEEEALYGGAAGGGKAIYVGEVVPSIDGWKTIAEVQVGDKLFDWNGEITEVIWTSPIMYNCSCYEVIFDDGAKIIVDAEHQWSTLTAKDREKIYRRSNQYREKRREKRPKTGKGIRPDLAKRNREREYDYLEPPAPSPKTTEEILRTLTVRMGRTNHSIPLTKPLNYLEKDLILEPYILGLWLGDGTSSNNGFTTSDQELLDRIEKHYEVTERSGKYEYGIIGIHRKLRLLNLLGNKHIPEQYLKASVTQRIELLKGLMDSDGSIGKNDGNPSYCTTSKILADNVSELLHSLGIKHQYRTNDATLDGRKVGYRYRFTFSTDTPIFELERKLKHQNLEVRKTVKQRYIKQINKVKSVPVKCLQVDNPDGIFIVGKNMIPTHNSDALLMGALQYVEVPGYSGIIFRRTFQDLKLKEALIDRSLEWLGGTDARWNGTDHAWSFPSGARLAFGYLEHERHKYRYQSAAFQYIAFDELTQFEESQYLYLFSRLRRLEDSNVPLRMRAATNPGGVGHEWVKHRFIAPGDPSRPFVPALLDDNPYIDRESYVESLRHLPPVTRMRLLRGDWSIADEGEFFRREWFQIVTEYPREARLARYWDLAATGESEGGKPAYTAGALVAELDGVYYVLDVKRSRLSPRGVEKLIRQTAALDSERYMGRVWIGMEQEPGSAGKSMIDHYAREVLLGYPFTGYRTTGSKETRAAPVSSAAEAGNVKLVRAGWNDEFLDEFTMFPEGRYKDQVDAVSGAVMILTGKSRPKVRHA